MRAVNYSSLKESGFDVNNQPHFTYFANMRFIYCAFISHTEY